MILSSLTSSSMLAIAFFRLPTVTSFLLSSSSSKFAMSSLPVRFSTIILMVGGRRIKDEGEKTVSLRGGL